MPKYLLTVFFSILINGSFAQKITNVFLSYKPSKDSLFPRRNHYDGSSVSILLYKNQKLIDTLKLWDVQSLPFKDSVLLSLQLPSDILSKSDSISVIPQSRFLYNNGGSLQAMHSYLVTEKDIPVSRIKLKLKSNPAGAEVYLVPKIIWDHDPLVNSTDQAFWRKHKVSQGNTPVWTSVQEYVYIAKFILGNRIKIEQVRPNHLTPVDSVFTDFSR